MCSEFPWLLTAATVQFLFNVYGCEAGDPFCGDIDGVPLGQRGVLPGPTQINCRAFRATRERNVPPLDPCCQESATLRTPNAVPRTPTHSYLKFGNHIIEAYHSVADDRVITKLMFFA